MTNASRQPALFPALLDVERDGVAVRGKLGEQPACEPRWLHTTDGRVFVAKEIRNAPPAVGCVTPLKALSELAVSCWSPQLGIEVPPAAFLSFGGSLWIGSERVTDALPAVVERLDRVAPRSAFDHLFVLDVLIENQDRHAGNVLLAVREDDERSVRLIAIDHERSSLGLHDAEGDFSAGLRSSNLMVDPLLRERVSAASAVAAAEQVRAALADALLEPFALGRSWCAIQTSEVEQLLEARLARLPELVAEAAGALAVPP